MREIIIVMISFSLSLALAQQQNLMKWPFTNFLYVRCMFNNYLFIPSLSLSMIHLTRFFLFIYFHTPRAASNVCCCVYICVQLKWTCLNGHHSLLLLPFEREMRERERNVMLFEYLNTPGEYYKSTLFMKKE